MQSQSIEVTFAYAVSLSCDASHFFQGVTRSLWSKVVTSDVGLGGTREDGIRVKKYFLF
jgi:hypothetical protein